MLIVFSCNFCIPKLPANLESYDSPIYFEFCLSSKMSEVQTAEKDISGNIKRIGIQLENIMMIKQMVNNKSIPMPPSIIFRSMPSDSRTERKKS